MGKGEDEEKDANWFPWHTKIPEVSSHQWRAVSTGKLGKQPCSPLYGLKKRERWVSGERCHPERVQWVLMEAA